LLAIDHGKAVGRLETVRRMLRSYFETVHGYALFERKHISPLSPRDRIFEPTLICINEYHSGGPSAPSASCLRQRNVFSPGAGLDAAFGDLFR
jgi:hypothetical protein